MECSSPTVEALECAVFVNREVPGLESFTFGRKALRGYGHWTFVCRARLQLSLQKPKEGCLNNGLGCSELLNDQSFRSFQGPIYPILRAKTIPGQRRDLGMVHGGEALNPSFRADVDEAKLPQCPLKGSLANMHSDC